MACIPCELDCKAGFVELHFEDVDLSCQNWFCALMSTTVTSNDARRYCDVHGGNVIFLYMVVISPKKAGLCFTVWWLISSNEGLLV